MNVIIRPRYSSISIIKSAGFVIILTLLGVGSVASLASLRYGSIKNAIARAKGHILLPDDWVKSFKNVSANQVTKIEYKIRNLSGHPIRLQGSQTSCSCTVVENFPRTIPSWGDTIIAVQIMAGPPGKKMVGGIDLITDESKQPVLHLGYSMQVTAESSVGVR